MKVKLGRIRVQPRFVDQTEVWTESEPFLDNPRGRLTHRVRAVQTIIGYKDKIHYSADFWCNGSVCFNSKDQLVSTPPEGRLVCARCEAKAVEKGQLTSDELAGQHVHKGVMRPVKTCCLENKN